MTREQRAIILQLMRQLAEQRRIMATVNADQERLLNLILTELNPELFADEPKP